MNRTANVLAGLLLAIGLGVGARVLWPTIAARLSPGGGSGAAATASAPQASPDLAEATLDRVETFRSGRSGARLVLGGAELSSLVRYGMPGVLPQGVSDPAVELKDGQLELSARIATSAFPRMPNLGAVMGMLPDTVAVTLGGELSRFGKEGLAFRVEHLEAGHIPLPDRLVPDVLTALGRTHHDGLASNALHLPMPGGLDSVSVRGDSLVLVARR